MSTTSHDVAGGSAPRPLPRGPHGLSREDVVHSQRERLLAAMTFAVAEKGYIKTSVADVLQRAGVSRATFYELFTDKEDCFRAAYEAVATQIAEMMTAGLEQVRAEVSAGDADPLTLLDRVLRIYLDLLAGAPQLARTFLVEVYAAGPKAVEQRRRSIELFVDIVAETHRGEIGLIGTDDEQRFAVEMLVDGVSSMVTNLVGTGQSERLPELHEPIMRLAEQLTALMRSASSLSD